MKITVSINLRKGKENKFIKFLEKALNTIHFFYSGKFDFTIKLESV